MKKGKSISLIQLLLSIVVLGISCRLFWNMGIYVDAYNTTPSVVLGGDFWLVMNWIQLGASLMLCLVACIGVYSALKR